MALVFLTALMVVAVALTLSAGNPKAAFAANGQLQRTTTPQQVHAGWTVSADHTVVSTGVKFVGRSVYYAQDEMIVAEWGGGWCDITECTPQQAAANNGLSLAVYPLGATIPQLLATQVATQPVPVVTQPAPQPVVQTTTTTTQQLPQQFPTGACYPFRPGALSPQWVIRFKGVDAAGNVAYETICGSKPDVAGAAYGPDFNFDRGHTQPFTLPFGYFWSGDAIYHGVAQFSGGDDGADMAVFGMCPWGACTIVPANGANVSPGGIDKALGYCFAKWLAGEKHTCAFIDPKPDGLEDAAALNIFSLSQSLLPSNMAYMQAYVQRNKTLKIVLLAA